MSPATAVDHERATIVDVKVVSEDLVAEVVTQISQRMASPRFTEVAVGTFMEQHPEAGQYIAAGADRLGGTEGVVMTVFHTQVLLECIQKVLEKTTQPMTFATLDEYATKHPVNDLSREQPALADYIASNVDAEPIRATIAQLAWCFHRRDLC